MKRAAQIAPLLVAVLVTLLTACATRDKGYVEDSDPEMAAAIAKAQATLPQFWQAFDQRAHGESNFVLVVIRVDFSVQLDATPRFYNNIMAYGDYGISVPLFAPRPMIAYNCIWQTQQPIPNEFMTNGNIFVNPRFVDVLNRDFRLLADSPCIDGGNPMSPADPDATRADQGAFVFDQRYQAWLQRYFSSSILADTNAEQTIWGLTADPDFDRALNLYEYFSGCDPLNADSDLQQLKLNLVGTNSVLTFRKSKRIVGITNELQGADILPIWNPTSAAELPLAELGGAFIFQTKVSNTGKDGQFFRMEVGLLP